MSTSSRDFAEVFFRQAVGSERLFFYFTTCIGLLRVRLFLFFPFLFCGHFSLSSCTCVVYSVEGVVGLLSVF